MLGEVRIMIDIGDAEALHRRAGSDYCLRSNGDPDAFDRATEILGTPDEPNLENCLKQLFERPAANYADAGLSITETSASVDAEGTIPQLATARIVMISTGHITREELDRVNEALGIEEISPMVNRVNEDVTHDGLHLSPKGFGFIVRVPSEDFIDEVLGGLTPEMRAIIEIAYAMGARRVEFDADEDPCPDLPYFGD